MSRDGTLPPGVEHSDPRAPWNQPDAAEWPCIDCGADVGESAIAWELHGRIAPRSECPECSEPLCSKCADKDSEISERCAKCSGVGRRETQEVKEQGR
jgi:hypothetical protein